MNLFFAEQMRIAMQCTQAAQQCQMMLLFPWMCWASQPRNTNEQQADTRR